MLKSKYKEIIQESITGNFAGLITVKLKKEKQNNKKAEKQK